MALEMDRGGDYTQAIESKKRRIRRRGGSGRSLQDLPPGEVFGQALNIFFTRPILIFPFLAAGILAAASEKAVRFLIPLMFNKEYVPIEIFSSLLGNPGHTMISHITHFAFTGLLISLVCVPLYASVIVAINNIYREKEYSIFSAISRSFSQLSALAGAAMVFFFCAAVGTAILAFCLDMVKMSLREFANFTFPIRPLAIVAIPVIGNYFVYSIPCIVLEKRQMEKSLSKSVQYGRKFNVMTISLLMCYMAIHVAMSIMVKTALPDGFPWLVLLLAPFMLFVTIVVSLIFIRAQEVIRGGGSRKKSRSQEDQPEYGEEPEPNPEPDDSEVDYYIGYDEK